MGLHIINQEQFDEIYKDHLSWLNGGKKEKKGDLSYCDLSGISFEKVSVLDCFVFRGAILKDIIFSNISMSDIDFFETNLIGCFFENIKAVSCVFEKCTLKDIEIRNSDFSLSNFSNANINSIFFYNTNLKNVNFSNSILFHTSIIKCDINGTVFNNNRIASIRFNNTIIPKKYKKLFTSENLIIDNSIFENQINKLEERIEKYQDDKHIDDENNTVTYGVNSLKKMNDLYEESIFLKRQIQINNGEIIEIPFKKKVINLLKSTRFWTILEVIVAIIALTFAAWTLYLNIQQANEEKKWKFSVHIEGYTVKNKEYLSITYLVPDNKVESEDLNALIPFRIKTKNKAVKNLKVEIFYYHASYEEKQYPRAWDKNLTNERNYEYKHGYELVTKSLPHITSHDAEYLNEHFRIYPKMYENKTKDGDGGFGSKKMGYIDNFIIKYRITCDEAEEPFLIAVCVNVFKADNREIWIQKAEEWGHGFFMTMPFMNAHNPNLLILPHTFFVANDISRPKITLWDNDMDLSFETVPLERFEYKQATFFKDRKLVFYSNEGDVIEEVTLKKLEKMIEGEKQIKDLIKKNRDLPDDLWEK